MIHKNDILQMARGIMRHDQGYRQQRLMYANREWTLILVLTAMSFVACTFFATRLYLELHEQVSTDTPTFIKSVRYEEERTARVLDVYTERANRFESIKESDLTSTQSMTDGMTASTTDVRASTTQSVVPIESRFPEKIVYGDDLGTRDEEELRNHCEREGGAFNTCGSVCPATAEQCTDQCALTCEFETAE